MAHQTFRLTTLAVAAVLTLSNCSKDGILNPNADVPVQNTASDRSRIVHHVSVGGADWCTFFQDKPGCNGNFSLVANMDADGNVSGQYTDQFGSGDGGFHATINCLNVVGDEAWVSGVVTSGNIDGVDITGALVFTKVRDNGPQGDEISLSFINDPATCDEEPDVQLYTTNGQVQVW